MTTKFKHFRIGLRRSAALLALAFATAATAQTILVTPGSLANYTYIPPGSGSGSGSGGGTGENVSTLQRCLWAPTLADQTKTIGDGFYDFNKEVTAYYRIVGGDGGPTAVGGGGGSSAILKNGAVVALGKGGDGGQSATQASGTFTFKKGDVLRFITGGGGGGGVAATQWGYTFYIGGGGGAGYTGGGGGASLGGRALTGTDANTSGGKGGGLTPGQGGYISGGLSGTAGIGPNGGVSTWSDGSSAPVGSVGPGDPVYRNAYSYVEYSYNGSTSVSGSTNSKHPATPTKNGSPTGDLMNGGVRKNWDGFFAGGGGRLGYGGERARYISSNTPNCTRANSSITSAPDYTFVDDNTVCATSYNQYKWLRDNYKRYPPHTGDMQLTRLQTPYYQNGNETYDSVPAGQIILMYQAPVCGLLQ